MSTSDENKWCWTRVQESRARNRNNTYKCVSEVLHILLTSCFAWVFFIIENILGIICLVLAIMYMNSCPVHKGIPLSMLVMGISLLIVSMTSYVFRCKFLDWEKPNDGFVTLAKLVMTIASFVIFFAFICVYDNVNQYNCEPILYWFAFIFCTIYLAIFLLVLVLACCLCCFA